MNYRIVIELSHDEEQNNGMAAPTQEQIIQAIYDRPWGPRGTVVDIHSITVDRY